MSVNHQFHKNTRADEAKPLSHTQFAQNDLNDYWDMSKIFVYDIASSTWYEDADNDTWKPF